MKDLREGKAEQPVLFNSVINRISTSRPEVLTCISEACDGAVIRAGKEIVVSTGVITEDIDDKCYYVLYRALNNCAAAQAEPVSLFTSVIMPRETERDTLKAYTDRFNELCLKEKISLAGGHSEVTDAVNHTVISAVCVGRKNPDSCEKKPDPQKGLSIVMTKYAGIEGTSILAHEKEVFLAKRFPRYFADEAGAMKKMVPALEDADAARRAAPVILHDVSKGGVLSALWDIAAAYDCGLDIDMQAIPIRQETVEICELFGLNPYELISGGSMLILTEDDKAVKDSLGKKGINSAVIGHTVSGSTKILRHGEVVQCMNRPAQDALLSVLKE